MCWVIGLFFLIWVTETINGNRPAQTARELDLSLRGIAVESLSGETGISKKRYHLRQRPRPRCFRPSFPGRPQSAISNHSLD